MLQFRVNVTIAPLKRESPVAEGGGSETVKGQVFSL